MRLQAPNGVEEVIGQNIRRLREAAGLTQRQLGVLVGSSEDVLVNKWEKGKHAPSAYSLFHLAKALNCSIDAFYEGWEA